MAVDICFAQEITLMGKESTRQALSSSAEIVICRKKLVHE